MSLKYSETNPSFVVHPLVDVAVLFFQPYLVFIALFEINSNPVGVVSNISPTTASVAPSLYILNVYVT